MYMNLKKLGYVCDFAGRGVTGVEKLKEQDFAISNH